jgi:sterol desaturase/sphingolipid hydroxylase (fatty acid hydroxylase superfamily)
MLNGLGAEWIDPATLKRVSAPVVLSLLLLWESVAPFMRSFAGRGRERLVHGVRNLSLGVINGICTAAALTTGWAAVTGWAAQRDFGILNWLDLEGAWRWAAALLLFDAWMYWWHRFNHRIPWLWRFHRVHHSDATMDVTTAHRFHLGEILLSSLLRVPLLAVLGMTLTELAVYETAMFAVVQLHHANVALPRALDRIVRTVIVTPSMHKVHHSRIPSETDSNYGSLMSWWDSVFRSRRARADLQAIVFGLEGFDDARRQCLGGVMRMPAD